MKRFLLFGGYFYYPHGGMQDYITSFDNLSEAKSYIQFLNNAYDKHLQGDGVEWAHIYDKVDRKIVYKWESDLYL